jgi:hypothetical protein
MYRKRPRVRELRMVKSFRRGAAEARFGGSAGRPDAIEGLISWCEPQEILVHRHRDCQPPYFWGSVDLRDVSCEAEANAEVLLGAGLGCDELYRL